MTLLKCSRCNTSPFISANPKSSVCRSCIKKELKDRDKTTKCHYCEIEEEDFQVIWGYKFYGRGYRGRTLEIEHKNGNKQDWRKENLVLACALCNMAKTDIVRYDEFKTVGNVIKEIWQKRWQKLSIHNPIEVT